MPDYKEPPAVVRQAPDIKNINLNNFLRLIGEIESSDGTNTNHKPVGGIHKGQAAIGKYGLMPATIRDIAVRLNRRDPKFQLSPEFRGDPDIEKYQNPNISDDEIRDDFSNSPELQNKAAGYLTNLLSSKTGNDFDKMAYGYNMGHNLDLKSLTEDQLATNPYVQKFRQFKAKEIANPENLKYNKLREYLK